MMAGQREVYRSPAYDPAAVSRLYFRALGGGVYRRFEVNQGGGTLREVDVEADHVDPRVRQLADERADVYPSGVELVDFGEALLAIAAQVDDEE